MRAFFKQNKILIIAVCVFALVSGVAIGNRISIEKNNKTYDIVADYSELELMAEQTHKNVSYWLKQFRDELDITKIGLAEESISSLMEDTKLGVNGKVMDEVMQDVDWQSKYPQEFINGITAFGYDSYDVVVETGTGEAADFVMKAMYDRFEVDKYFSMNVNGKAYVLIDGDSTNALYSQPYKLANSKRADSLKKLT